MAQRLDIVPQTILGASPAEVQVFFETYFKQLGVEAQITKMVAKRDSLATGLKKQRQKLREANTDIQTKLREGEPIPAELAQEFKGNHIQALALNVRIEKQYRRGKVSASDIRPYREVAKEYDSDCLGLATTITGWKVEATANLDPMILARIEARRQAKKKEKA